KPGSSALRGCAPKRGMTRPTKRSRSSASATRTTRFRRRCWRRSSGSEGYSGKELPRQGLPRLLVRRVQEYCTGVELAEVRAARALILAAHERRDRRRAIDFAGELEKVAHVLVHQLERELGAEVAREHLRQLGLHHAAAD